jgi:hypothetical protein
MRVPGNEFAVKDRRMARGPRFVIHLEESLAYPHQGGLVATAFIW